MFHISFISYDSTPVFLLLIYECVRMKMTTVHFAVASELIIIVDK